MMEERGRIVQIEEAGVWVETRRQSACGKCQAESTCGHGLMNKLMPARNLNHVRASCDLPVSIGDEVTIALPEQALLSASLLVYLLPLLAMLAGAVFGTLTGLAEPLVIMLSLAGLVGGFLGVRWWTHKVNKGRYEPVVLTRHIPLNAVVKSAVSETVLEQK